MKTKFYILISILFFAFSVSAHPLGNFSVNQYSRLEVDKSQIKIRQILDLAEIPTFQLLSELDADKNELLSDAELKEFTNKYLANLSLTLNNVKQEISVKSQTPLIKKGVGDLLTLRIEWNLSSDSIQLAETNSVQYVNNNYVERVGWNEIVLNQIGNINIFDSSAFGSPLTDELKAYPETDLNVALAERSANFTFSTRKIPEGAKILQNRDGHQTVAVQRDRLAELIAVPEVTPTIMLFGLLVAFGLGAVHAMSPGHGKTVVGAYLVGSRGTIKHAMFLGATVTITHTIGVFALGLITLFASNYILPEKMMPFLSFISGLMVLYIGLTMLKSRLFSALGWDMAANHHHDHSHSSNHNHSDEHPHHNHSHSHNGQMHTHLPPEEISWKSLLTLGVSGGLLPCPSALVLMLSAINLGRIIYGLVLTVAFSFGLAMTLMIVGLIFIYGGRLIGNSKLSENKIFRVVPILSAFFIACVGSIICYSSLF